MNASVEPVNSGMTEGFKWSLKPILLYLKLLGVNFEPSKPDPTRSGVLAFHLQRLAGFSVTILPFLWFICLPQDMTWNTTIEFLSFQYFPIGIHWGLLIVRQKEKDKFWELIKQIETRFEYGSGIFRRFRRLSIATLLCCLFWVNEIFHPFTRYLPLFMIAYNHLVTIFLLAGYHLGGFFTKTTPSVSRHWSYDKYFGPCNLCQTRDWFVNVLRCGTDCCWEFPSHCPWNWNWTP